MPAPNNRKNWLGTNITVSVSQQRLNTWKVPNPGVLIDANRNCTWPGACSFDAYKACSTPVLGCQETGGSRVLVWRL